MRKTFAIVFFLPVCLTHTAGFGYAAFDVTGRATASPPSRSASIATGGLPSAVTNAAGLAELHAYDALGRVTGTVFRAQGGAGAQIAALSYAYDASGFVTQRVHTAASGAVSTNRSLWGRISTFDIRVFPLRSDRAYVILSSMTCLCNDIRGIMT